MTPEVFVLVAGLVVTVLAGWITAAVVLVRDGTRRRDLPAPFRPLRPVLSHFLGKPPKMPKVRSTARYNRITLDWTCGQTSAWNDDHYEVQTDTEDERIKSELGSEYLRSYYGRLRTYTIGELPPNHALKFRVRSVNQSGKSPWSPVAFARTACVPKKNSCGGRVEWGAWNQTHEFVELLIDVPDATTNKTLTISVKATSIDVRCERAGNLLRGDLHGPVKSSDLVDWTWELESWRRGDEGGKILRIELEKTRAAERRADLWPRVLRSGLAFDVDLMQWDRAWENNEGWEHVLRSEAGQLRPDQLKLDDYIS